MKSAGRLNHLRRESSDAYPEGVTSIIPLVGLPVRSNSFAWGSLGLFGSEAEDQIVVDHAATHVAVQHECDASEHPPLSEAFFISQDSVDSLREPVVVGHRVPVRA